MKRTTIKYTKLDDGNIRIDEIKNVSAIHEIEEEFDTAVAGSYHTSLPLYFKEDNGLVAVAIGDGMVYHVKPGDVMTEKDFKCLTSIMMDASDRLLDIRRMVERMTTGSILI
jgi:hypothetical protein